MDVTVTSAKGNTYTAELSSSNTGVAHINDRSIEGIKPGAATITYTVMLDDVNSLSVSAGITVTAADASAVSSAVATIKVSETIESTVTGIGNDTTILWKKRRCDS